MCRNYLLTLCLLLLFRIGFGQLVLVNSSSEIYSVNQSGTLCNYANAGAYCNPDAAINFLFSTALHKDTLYMLARNSTLYRMKLGNPSSCIAMTTFAANSPFGVSINSLVVSRDGMVYAADGDSRELFRYNPYTNVKTRLGVLDFPASPAGDLIFYKDKLLLATKLGSIYEVNIDNPSASTVYIPSPGGGLVFFGLIAVPFDCTLNKYYGLEWWNSETRLWELDMENRVVLGVTCTIPFLGFDGASNVDDGNTLGVIIDAIKVQAACGNNTLAAISIIASTATGSLTYTLDGTTTNTTGIFTGLSEGSHSLRVQNERNCFKDTVFSILHGLSPVLTINTTNPVNCNLPNGGISIVATSGYPPVTYSLDGGSFVSSGQFTNLGGGSHTVSIMDAGGCRKDTTVILSYQTLPSFLSSVIVTPTFCTSNSGEIAINLGPGINPADVVSAINNGALQPALSYNMLDAGQYLLSLVFQQTCRYDTLIEINRLKNPTPDIQLLKTDQKCFTDNGSVRIQLAGTDNPYRVNFNSTGYSDNMNYQQLAPGNYPISIIDNDGCLSDTSIRVNSYNLSPSDLLIEKTDPTCKDVKGGKIRVVVSGNQGLYSFSIDNRSYDNGVVVNNLVKGDYKLIAMNGDGCRIDSAIVSLKMDITPDCETLFIPTAFTPDNNGRNDIFRVFAGEAIIGFEFRIYDRAGQLVFATADKNKGWDGKVNGVLQGSGVFAWTVKYHTLTNAKQRIRSGTMVLIN
jgi:gliding motility-associated-like protein